MRRNVVFGAGARGEKFLVKWHSKIVIAEIFDNYKKDNFYGYTIQRPYYDPNVFIIVAVDGFERYLSIRQQLLSLGYTEFDDFVPHTIYKKRMAIAYGNCHMMTIKSYLELSPEFDKEYGFYPFPPIQQIPENLQITSIIRKSELFIHQAIRKENNYRECYSSENVIKNVKKDCYVLAIPNLHGLPKCFFPQFQTYEKPKRLMYGLSLRRDVEIENWINHGVSIEEMERMISEGGAYSKEYIIQLWEEFKVKLESRETEWDIKISDYIYSHYQKEKLFTDRWHITTFLAREIANRILERLKCTPIQGVVIPGLDSEEVFIYADVKKALDLKFEETSIRNFSKMTNIETSTMTLKAYLEMYTEMHTFIEDRLC